MARSPNRRHNDRPLYNVRDARRHNGGRRSRSPEASWRRVQKRSDQGTDRDQRRGGSNRSDYREYRDSRDDRGRGREYDRGYETRREDYGRLRPSSRDRGTKRAYNDPSPTRSSRENGRERRDEHDSKRSRRRTPTPPRSAEEAAKATQEARLKQVEEWKRKKQLTKKTADDTIVGDTASNSPGPLESTTMSIASPTTNTPNRRTSPSQTASPPQKDDASAFYNVEALNRPGVKFDAKAFALNRAKGKDDKKPKVLGGDIAIPKVESRAPATQTTRFVRDGTKGEKITGFGLTHVQNDRAKTTASALMDDAEIVTRRLEKLPDMPTEEMVPDESEQQDDQDDASVHSDDEVDAEAARQAFRKRAEEAEKENARDDATMADSNGLPPDEEEIDPLDAFMSTLELPAVAAKTEQPERRLFDGEDDFSMTAVGDEDMNALGAAMAAKSKKKDLPKVDHSKIDYEPFRKSFYTEPEELQNMSQEEVEELRMQLDNISVKPANAPKPIQKFSLGGFSEQILQVIQANKYESTTPIQAQALPSIMSGRDVIGIARTGSGKTVAYLLPMLRHVKDQRPVANLEGPIALILAPTRELATQIHRDSKPYAKSLGLRAVCAYGGSPISESIADCKRGADFMVCTPGRMIDLLSANGGRVTNLRRVTYLVLDEADRMFDLGFEPQIMKILNNIRPDAQKVLFSATFRVSMESLAHKVLNKAIQINVGGRSVVAPDIKQIVEVRQEEDKFNRLLELLGEVHAEDGDERSLVFVERQETADKLFVELSRRGYPAVSIHGGREQIDRDQAIGDFRAGIYPVMVATSVAARGLDVKQLVLVVNYDSPNHLEDYVHRCGRTGRAGNKGTAVTFVTPQQDRFAKFLSQALTEAGQEVPDDIKALQSSYDKKVASGEIKKYNSGFGGRGIDRLEAARDAERARQREQHKPIDGEEAEEEEEGDEANKDKRDKDPSIEDMVKKAASAVTDRDAKPDVTAAQIMPSALNDKLNSAMVVQKAEPAPAKTANLSDPAARAAAVASSINSRLGGAGKANRPGAPSENRGPDAGAFHAVLEINDFPQKARWSVTNRTNVAKILEATGTSITTKGNFYAPGSEPEPGGQPKLYILVEGDTELVVESAMRELTKLLREGTYAALEEEGKKATGGRYSVV